VGRLLAFAGLLALAACGGGTPPAPSGKPGVFLDETLSRLPADHDFGQDAALGDVDGNGTIDVVVPVFKGPNRLLLNDGDGHFTDDSAARLPAERDASVHAGLADLDGDGDLDLVMANEGANRLYRNLGPDQPGVFEEVPLPGGMHLSESVALGDVDGDGDLDLAFGNLGIGTGGEGNTLLRNDGDLVFTEIPLSEQADATYQVLLLDADGDGDLDLFSANNAMQNRLLLNDGHGVFTDVTATHLPVDTDSCTAAVAGDVDGDGDLDIVTLTFETTPNRLLRNDGDGHFTAEQSAQLNPQGVVLSYDGDLADVDGDGDLDLLVVGAGSRLFLNDGQGNFSFEQGAMPPDWTFSAYDVDVADLDGDGLPDAFVSVNGDGPDRLYRNGSIPPSGPHVSWIQANHGPQTGGTSVTIGGQDLGGVTEVDVGGQPLADLAVTSPGTLTGRTPAGPVGPADLHVMMADGAIDVPAAFEYDPPATGSLFADATDMLPPDSDAYNAVLSGDLDGDGHPDLVYLAEGGPHVLLLYDPGSSTFVDHTATGFPATNTATWNTAQAGALADVDGDGDLDIVIADDGFYTSGGPGKPDRLYLNDGNAVFTDATDAQLPADTSHSNGVAAADLDGDGYPDLVFANEGANLLYRNRGAAAPGTFEDVSATNLPANTEFSRTVTAFDADGDGDLDLLFGEKDARNRLLLNDGHGVFTDATDGRLPDEMADGQNDTVQVLALDVDGDNDMDLVLARSFVQAALLYRNDGSGHFSDDGSFEDPDPGRRLYGSTAVVAADFDQDTRTDLAFSFWIMTPTARVLPGDGTGGFHVQEGLVAPAASSLTGLAPLDFDGDGDVDLAVAANGGVHLLRNLSVP
jgi:hypothetical protein